MLNSLRASGGIWAGALAVAGISLVLWPAWHLSSRLNRIEGGMLFGAAGSIVGLFWLVGRQRRASRADFDGLSDARRDSLDFALSQQFMALERARSRVAVHQARTDQLTGVPNRRHFVDQSAQALEWAVRHGRPLTLLMIDVDQIQRINDASGYAAGDAVLRGLADRLRATVPALAVLGRVGGAHFAATMTGAEASAARQVAQALRDSLERRPFVLPNGQAIRATVSFGLADRGERQVELETLMQEADQALGQAKADGRDALCQYTDAVGERARQRAQIAQDLRGALEAGQFRIDHQPVFDSVTGELIATEALLRWHHPQRGRVAPLEFIGLAEETGLIVPIGAWVLEQACRDAAGWERPLKVAVNLSARQLHDADLVERVRGVLARTGLPPQRLELEVTESALACAEQASRVLEALHALGVGLALDDFGTGYSSLAYLQRFRFDRIKIDRAFVQALHPAPSAAVHPMPAPMPMAGAAPDGSAQVPADPAPLALVRAVIDMARALGLPCTAEGVEHDSQLQALRALGCAALQGFHLAMPMANAELRRFAAAQPRVIAPAQLAFA
ncbi:MAG: putative bifunctional diguanylate cyclase/phosphodiesterase [Leptothrix sp. (in: b-proteobacteria)]